MIVFDDGHDIAAFERHSFLKLIEKGKKDDPIFDSWLRHFQSRNVPVRVVELSDGRRKLYKHKTRVSNTGLMKCCEKFKPEAEGRDLEAEAYACGFRDTHCRGE